MLYILLITALLTVVSADIGNWKLTSKAAVPVVEPQFMLRHEEQTVTQLRKFVTEVSTPDSPMYGKYMNAKDVARAFPPMKGAKEAVFAFLEQHGVPHSMVSTSVSGDMISAKISVDVARSMFKADLFTFDHTKLGQQIVRAPAGYTMPGQLSAFVYLIGNLVEFPKVSKDHQKPDVTQDVLSSPKSFGSDCQGCEGMVTPAVLGERYGFNVSESLSGVAGDTGMATAEFQGVFYRTGCLEKFQQDCSMKQAIQVDRQIGANHGFECPGGSVCDEAHLDIEYAKAASGGINLTNIFNSGFSLLNWAKQVDDMGDDAPAVHSISYSADEAQQGKIAPHGMSGPTYMHAVDVQFAKLAAKGITIVISAGDSGVCGNTGCSGGFKPMYPASSPYVTTVGGTDFAQKSVIGEEKAWSNGGGGFSNTFSTPSWQQQAVEGYLTASAKAGNLPTSTLFNRSGRGYPDVSALGGEQNPYCIATTTAFYFSGMKGVSGTSASAPVFAGLVARLNAARLAQGKPRMGFMNPWIYQHPEAFYDVSKGSNPGAGSAGFAAIPGWDSATGMGTPNFPEMLRLALSSTSSPVVV